MISLSMVIGLLSEIEAKMDIAKVKLEDPTKEFKLQLARFSFI